MALLTDGVVSSLSDLQAFDSGILETARTEGIDLSAKLAVAAEHLRLEIASYLHAVRGGGVFAPGADSYDVRGVVVTPGLRRWHTLRTLVEVYSDAYNSQLNDRYLGKWRHFVELTRETMERVAELGVGLVSNPVPQAGRPVVTGSGAGGPIGTYLVRVAWRSASGASGSASEAVAFQAIGGEMIQVDAGQAPAGVVGFDVYAGLSGQAPGRQNDFPVPAGQLWTPPESGLINGPEPGSGQSPEYFARRSRVL